VLRFQRLLSFAASGRRSESLAALAVDAGYADQAHMTREVRRFADHVPSALLSSTPCTLEMFDLFKIRDDARDHSLERDAQRAHDSGDRCSFSRRRERR
jgi:AraC-like DNA-binding protein